MDNGQNQVSVVENRPTVGNNRGPEDDIRQSVEDKSRGSQPLDDRPYRLTTKSEAGGPKSELIDNRLSKLEQNPESVDDGEEQVYYNVNSYFDN